MSEFKGTSGTWQPFYISGICMGVEATTDIEGYSQVLCNPILPETDKEYAKEKKEIIANITLMAAAPDLLEALIELNNCLDDYWNATTKTERLIKEITKQQQLSLAAINKALGKGITP